MTPTTTTRWEVWYEDGWYEGDWQQGDHHEEEGWQDQAWYESGWADLPAGEKAGNGVVEGSVQDEESFDYYKGKNKGKGSVGLGCVVRSGTTLTLVAWVMLPGGQEEVEKDSAKAAKEEKALASSARAKGKDTVREKDQTMVTGKAMVSEAIGWTMKTTWVLQQRGIARLARASTMVFGVLPRGYLDPEGEI